MLPMQGNDRMVLKAEVQVLLGDRLLLGLSRQLRGAGQFMWVSVMSGTRIGPKPASSGHPGIFPIADIR